MSAQDTVPTSAQVDGMREAFRWGLGAGFALGLGTALIVVVGAILVTQ